ncbi:MAG TPA: rod-binding protein [Terriglobales bacterium]|nr:rod-binding protein [Terriglobales bacterium]
MSGVPPLSGPGSAPPRDDAGQLRRMAHELEGVFLNQLFQAMRASVPQGGLVEEGAGEEMFRSLLDEQVAREAAARDERGLGEALFRQLARRLAAKEETGP